MSTQTEQSQSALTALARRDPTRICEGFHEACNAGDLETLIDFYEPDAVIRELDGSLSAGPEAIRASMVHLMSLKPRLRTVSTSVVVRDDLALSKTHFTFEGTAPDGSAIRMDHHACDVSRRQADGTWKVIIDHPFD
jgi:uncharacterized protein (TIGR02246 family)